MLLYVNKVRYYADGKAQAHVIDDNLVENVITTDTFLLRGNYYAMEDVNIIDWRAYSEQAWNTLRV